ncbi:uncharacterized protein LOC125055023 isoform X2 [Pieris napi]|uniref:uncharacterized protein LOC125055023 isoform X2 n=1 Tax=Pieris napi TaxID=78633 RepID=UPI001FBBECCD|nr:uncharacterized protein LOC125055023 isoform X2 [Pieris napi]
MSNKEESSDSDGPVVNDNVIRIQLRKPTHRKWELRTRNLSPGIKFPTIQLFDSEGNLLVETNDENISVKSVCYDETSLKSSQSLREKESKRTVYTHPIRKQYTISGDRIYTRIYKGSGFISNERENCDKNLVVGHIGSQNIPNKQKENRSVNSLNSILDTTPFMSDYDVSSYKSSDNETNDDLICAKNHTPERCIQNEISEEIYENNVNKDKENNIAGLHGSQSFTDPVPKYRLRDTDAVQRSQSGIIYKPPPNKVSFLNTYLKSITARRASNTGFILFRPPINDSPQNSRNTTKAVPNLNCERSFKSDITDNDYINIPTDVAADSVMKNRLKIYRRGISEIGMYEESTSISGKKRRHSVSTMQISRSSSSESVDEADVILNRLRRRIVKNKLREKRRSVGTKLLDKEDRYQRASSDEWRNAGRGALVRSTLAMGSNISQHSAKGLKGRRARSSGDLCNGETKSQTESSVCGSVVGDVMAWNRSLPNHLDGNRHLADYSRVNNNYGEFATYRCHPKGGRGLRYRISKSGSDAEPVWKLQDPGFDQGYGSERSPEDDYVPPIPPAISLEEYEAELRAIYPFITDDNSFTVVVEKDGRGLGMSVCGGGGLVRIRRLYPPQPAWRTGQLAPKDLLLSANGVPLAGLSTYEALEVLRTAEARVELRVCRPPNDVLESITPPDPPTPPARTPHPPHLPLDPLNCHPLHARLSQTTSSATTSSSEGRGRRDASPEDRRHDLQLPDLDRPLPIYDIQYGEFDIVMTKVNGSLGFTLRKEDHSALGHYVRALVREPALSDGRIQPGDRIVAVNDTSMSNMSHADAVAFLRACGSEVRLRLYRDHAATPLSPMSPKEEVPTDSDPPLNKPKPPLRAEAVSMLCDLAARRLTPDAADGSRSPCLSPRKFRKLTKDNNHYEQPNDLPRRSVEEPNLIVTKITNSTVYLEEVDSVENMTCTCLPPLPIESEVTLEDIEHLFQEKEEKVDRDSTVPLRPPRKKATKKSHELLGKQSSLQIDEKQPAEKRHISCEVRDDLFILKSNLNELEQFLTQSIINYSNSLGQLSSETKPPSNVKGEENNKISPLDPNVIENYYENVVGPLNIKFEQEREVEKDPSIDETLKSIRGETKNDESPLQTFPCTCSFTVEELRKFHKDGLLPSSIKDVKQDDPMFLDSPEQTTTNLPISGQLLTKNKHLPIQRSKTQRFTRSHSIRKRLLSKRFKSKTINGPIYLEKKAEATLLDQSISQSVDDYKTETSEEVKQTVVDTFIDCRPERPNFLVIGAPEEAKTEIQLDEASGTKLKKPVLTSPTTPPSCRDQKLSLTVIPQNYELNNLDNDTLDAPNAYQEQQRYEPAFSVDSDEPASMPAELSSDERFKHSNPTYQSAVLHSSTTDSASDKDEGNGLKKWKGVALSPDNERKIKPLVTDAIPKPKIDTVQKENINPEPPVEAESTEPTIVTVELNRGWNSRLGFSVQSHPESGQSYISAVYSDSVAARDGRLRRGDVILQVNDENVTSMKTPEVIDLLRILRGSICITVLRPNTQ